MKTKKQLTPVVVKPVVILKIIDRIRNGEKLISSPARWWDPINPFIVRFEGKKPIDSNICDEMRKKRLLRVKRTVKGIRELELTNRGMSYAA